MPKEKINFVKSTPSIGVNVRAQDILSMEFNEIIEVHSFPYYRVLKVINGWLYNFYDVEADSYLKNWVYVPEK